jgi:intracellular sulfur oxidation DsrE/DsrF family protein
MKAYTIEHCLDHNVSKITIAKMHNRLVRMIERTNTKINYYTMSIERMKLNKKDKQTIALEQVELQVCINSVQRYTTIKNKLYAYLKQNNYVQYLNGV